MNRAHRAALEAVEGRSIGYSEETGWGVYSPAWWDGFRGRSLDAILAAGLIRIIPSKHHHHKTVRATAAGMRALNP